MPEVKPPIETIAKIKVIGVGGSGGSAVNRMIAAKVQGVEFIVVNTDLQALQVNNSVNKLHIGKTTTRGLGAGMNPELGRKAAEESQNEIREMLKGSDMVFITCGLGGGTGSGAAPVIADLAKEHGALTIAVVTKPFLFEGGPRKKIADDALRQIESKVDALIVIPNDKIWQMIDKKTPLLEAFALVDEILRQGVQGISEIITATGAINVDFADVKTIMSNAGSALMGVGEATGDNRAIEAAKAAISSPLLETSIEGAKGVLFSVTAGPNMSMHEVNDVAKIITEKVDSDARIIFGTVVDENLKDSLKVTVIATGFEKKDNLMRIPQSASSSVTYFGQPMKPKTEQRSSALFTSASSAASEDRDDSSYMKDKPKEAPKKEARDEEDSDDFEIPAFIRKKMM